MSKDGAAVDRESNPQIASVLGKIRTNGAVAWKRRDDERGSWTEGRILIGCGHPVDRAFEALCMY